MPLPVLRLLIGLFALARRGVAMPGAEHLAPRSERDFEETFTTFVKRQASALIVGQSSFLSNNGGKIRALAMRHMIPAIYPFSGYVRGGGRAHS
jgi:hypothetical protein